MNLNLLFYHQIYFRDHLSAQLKKIGLRNSVKLPLVDCLIVQYPLNGHIHLKLLI
jgi:hypothetical protein